MSIRDLAILKGALSELRNVRITPHCPSDPAKPDFLLKLPSGTFLRSTIILRAPTLESKK